MATAKLADKKERRVTVSAAVPLSQVATIEAAAKKLSISVSQFGADAMVEEARRVLARKKVA